MQRETSVQTELCSDEEKKSEVLARKLEEVKKEKATLLAEVGPRATEILQCVRCGLKHPYPNKCFWRPVPIPLQLLGEKADSELKVMELKKQVCV
eukprot:1160932-Pelagomonas_calceolata.AAC.7